MRRTLYYRVLVIISLALITLTTFTSSRRQITIFMVGDSTMANKDISKGSPERGWGMVLQGCFSEDVIIDNHAVNGRSSRSFIDEGRWQKVLDLIKPGDYVFIQFGHNDEKHDQEVKAKRFSAPGSSFDDNLLRYVTETRQRGGIPVLFNCVERRLFYDASKETAAVPDGVSLLSTASVSEAAEQPSRTIIPANPDKPQTPPADDETLRDTKYGSETINTEYLVPTHYTADGDYAAVPYLVAKQNNVPFVDANRISHWMEQEHGVIESRKLHVWLKPGEVASIPDGRRDNTHYSIYGAHVISNLLADAIGDAVPALKPFVRHYDYVVSDKGRGNYLSLDDAIKAISSTPDKQGTRKTTILVLDGTYKKPILPDNVKLEVRETAKIVR